MASSVVTKDLDHKGHEGESTTKDTKGTKGLEIKGFWDGWGWGLRCEA